METSLLAVLGVVITAVFSVLGVLISVQASRISQIEREVEDLDAYNDEMWEWCREQLDMYYRYRKDGAPNPKPIPKRKKTNN